MAGLLSSLLIFLYAAGPLMADDGAGVYTVIGGSGLTTCETWLDVRGTDDVVENQLKSFGAGFLTAYNRYVFKGKNVAQGHSTESLLLWADSFCRKNPKERITTMMEMMIYELNDSRAQ